MRRSERSKVLSGLLAVVLLVITAAWSPAALAQEAATPVSMAESDCGAAAMSLPGEVLPDGVVRELLVTTGVDSTAFASEDVPALSAVASVVCIAANTEVVVGVDGGPDTADIPQDYTVTLVVLEGELELKLVEACAAPDASGACATTGQADFRPTTDYSTPVAIAADWTLIPSGSIVVLSDVTISMRTTESAVRLLSTGVASDTIGGGACPTSCAHWKYP